jgi:hypothetical protein
MAAMLSAEYGKNRSPLTTDQPVLKEVTLFPTYAIDDPLNVVDVNRIISIAIHGD